MGGCKKLKGTGGGNRQWPRVAERKPRDPEDQILRKIHVGHLRELLIKKCSLIMDFFQKGLTPPLPPQTFGTFGALFRRLIFFWNFWGTFCVVFYQNQGKKCPKTFGFGQPVLPSRSALSDLGLIADLFEKMPLNWSSFCVKSPLFGQKSPKSLIFNVSAFHINQKKLLKNFLNYEIFSNKS